MPERTRMERTAAGGPRVTFPSGHWLDENTLATTAAAFTNAPFGALSFPFALGGGLRAAARGEDFTDRYWQVRDWYLRNMTPMGEFLQEGPLRVGPPSGLTVQQGGRGR